MIKRALFAVVFVPVHAVLTVLCVVHWLNWNYVVDMGLWPRFVNLCARVLSLPLLLPLMMLDPDGERFPMWFRHGSVLVNSLLWAILILFVIAGIKRLRSENNGTPNQALEDIGA